MDSTGDIGGDIATITRRRFETMSPGGRGGPVGSDVDASGLPPGPRMPALLQSVGLLRFRHRWLPALHRKHGDIFSIRILPEGRRLVVFNRPEHLREIFAGDPEVFHAGKGNAILGPVMGEHSLLLLDGAGHKRARKLLMPAFSAKALRGYQDMIAGIAKTEVGSWGQGAEDPSGPEVRTFASLGRMNALTLEVILQVVFGITDEKSLAELRPLVNKTVNLPRWSSSGGASHACSGSGRGAARSRTRSSWTGCSTGSSVSGAAPGIWPSAPTYSPGCCRSPTTAVSTTTSSATS